MLQPFILLFKGDIRNVQIGPESADLHIFTAYDEVQEIENVICTGRLTMSLCVTEHLI